MSDLASAAMSLGSKIKEAEGSDVKKFVVLTSLPALWPGRGCPGVELPSRRIRTSLLEALMGVSAASWSLYYVK